MRQKETKVGREHQNERDRQEPREEQGSYSELDRKGRPLGREKRDGQTDKEVVGKKGEERKSRGESGWSSEKDGQKRGKGERREKGESRDGRERKRKEEGLKEGSPGEGGGGGEKRRERERAGVNSGEEAAGPQGGTAR